MLSHTNLAYLMVAAWLPVINAALYQSITQIEHGSIQGYPAFNATPAGNLTNWRDITVWKGIPFAASTSGQNRFKPPQPADLWNVTLQANTFGNVCPSGAMNPDLTIGEDCLNLNVWSAANSSDSKLPVVMWSYPAGGSAADALFDGAGLADKGVVFVNYNYRTGSFGWLAHPELSMERFDTIGKNSSGNWGMLDQFAALKWIRSNIAAFGGDPDRVTVMGQSAGSAATYHIVNSPLTEGDIVGAIIESGVRDPRDPLSTSLAENYQTLEIALETGVKYVASLNVSSIEEMRELPMSELVTQFMGSWDFTATLDSYAMPGTYLESLLNGAANDVPILTGNTKDESGATYGLNISLNTYISEVNATYNDSFVADFLALYPANDSMTASAAYNAQFSDRSKVGTYTWSQLWATASVNPVYTYFWDHAPPGQNRGAYHESEINYVLNNLYGTDMPWTADDYAIAAKMNGYWVNFIKSGNPNGANLTGWAPANGQDLVVQELGDRWDAIPLASKAQVALFEQWFETLPAH